MTNSTNDACIYISIFILLFMLFIFIFMNCVYKENFTAPGLTLIKPPSWFPQNSAKAYSKNDWKTKMYLDRYDELNNPNANNLAFVYRFWRI